jgi:phosphate acyltransferase
MRHALRLVRSGRCAGAVSCGNTGAWLVSSVLELGNLESVERPAIASVLPRSDGGRLVLMDAGANVDCKPEHLASFARLGSVYAAALGVSNPRVGLLSNGEEDTKGNLQVRATLPLLRSLDLNMVGPIEPSAAMSGACDVLICDGFVGNVLLKAAEGAVQTVVTLLREEIERRATGKLGAFLLRGAFRRFRTRVAWDAQGGALLLGVKGLVVVGHGKATPEAVEAAIRMAYEGARNGLVDQLVATLEGASKGATVESDV